MNALGYSLSFVRRTAKSTGIANYLNRNGIILFTDYYVTPNIPFLLLSTILLSKHVLIPILINNIPLHKFYGIEYYWKLSSVGATSWSRHGD